MSFLKQILKELHVNVVRDEQHQVPNVWSRNVHQRLGRNTDHWHKVQRRDSHVGDMDFQTDVDAEIPYHDDQWDREAADVTYNDRFDDSDFDDAEFSGIDWDDEGEAHRLSDYGSTHAHPEEEDEETMDLRNFRARHGHVDDEAELDSYRGFNDEHPDRDMYADAEMEDRYGRRHIDVGDDEDHEYGRSSGDDEWDQLFGLGSYAEEEEDSLLARMMRDRYKEEEQEDLEDEAPKDQQNADDEEAVNKAVDDQYGLDDPNDSPDDFGDIGDQGEPEEWDDPDYQGVIRVVPGAHLVYKRQQEDGTFDELWQFNLGSNFDKELKIRRGILAGTDIPINKMKSPDGSQSFEIWTAGNGQLLKIRGLPN